jgi:hypothetical protein
MNEDCLESICHHVPLASKIDFRNTCRSALSMRFLFTKCFMKWLLDFHFQREWRRTVTVVKMETVSGLNELYATQGLRIEVELSPPLLTPLSKYLFSYCTLCIEITSREYFALQPFFIILVQLQTNGYRMIISFTIPQILIPRMPAFPSWWKVSENSDLCKNGYFQIFYFCNELLVSFTFRYWFRILDERRGYFWYVFVFFLFVLLFSS